MIILHSPSRRPVAVPKQQHQHPTTIVSKIGSEAKRRDNIIKAIVSGYKVKEGQTYEAFSEESRDTYGPILIEQICDSYAKYGRAKWPENDYPLLLTGYSEKTKQRFYIAERFLKV